MSQADAATGASRREEYALGGAALAYVAAAAGDTRYRAFTSAHRTSALDHAASAVDPLGQAGVLVPALIVTVVAPRLARDRPLSDAAARIALTYVAADAIESILKPVIGRHRPDDGGGPWRFRPFVNDAEWHSVPSAHTVHAFALATGLSLESHSLAVDVPAYALASLVGAERVYRVQHWTSDVVASAVLAVVVGRVTDSALRRHGIPWLLPPVSRPTSTPFAVTRVSEPALPSSSPPSLPCVR